VLHVTTDWLSELVPTFIQLMRHYSPMVGAGEVPEHERVLPLTDPQHGLGTSQHATTHPPTHPPTNNNSNNATFQSSATILTIAC
jgi:hypothetical protein